MDVRTPARAIVVVVLSIIFSAASLHAQPRIEQIQNNYSYLLPDNPSYGIAQGSIFIVKGSNLASTATPLQNPPLKTILEGVTAKVTVGGTTTDVIWYYVTPNQLGGILPSRTPVGTGTIVVTNGSGTSAPAQIRVVQSAFGTISLNGSGAGEAAAFDLGGAASLLSRTNSAQPGEHVILFGTGLGPTTDDETINQTAANLPFPVVVEIGGLPAAVPYHGRSLYAGLDQINLIVPAGVAPGCNVPLVVKTGAFASNVTTIPVAMDGGECPAPPAPTGSIDLTQAEIDGWLAAGQFRSGSIGLTRQASYTITEAGTTLTRSDVLSAGFNRIAGPDLPKLFTSTFGLPASGACVVYAGAIQNPLPNLTYTSLDAGAFLTVSGAGTQTAPKSVSGGVIGYLKTLSDSHTYLQPGRFTVTGPGGPDIGSFSGSLDIAPDLVWTNRNALAVVDRTQPLTVSWSGGEPATLVTISGTGVSGTTPASFICTAPNTDRQFTVPVSVLSQLPASPRITAGTVSILQRGSLTVSSVGKGARLTATGIDYLTVGNQWGISQSTEYK